MAKAKHITFNEFIERFGSENACEEYLLSIRIKEGFVCPECGCTEYYYVKDRRLFQCKQCRHQTSLTAGTVMHKTHLSLQVWFWAIYLVAYDKRGHSATQLSRELKLTYKTAWFLLHRIRHAMGERDKKYLLSGIVELDDTYFGSTKKGSKRGRGTSKIKVVVAVSKNKAGKPQFAKMNIVKNLKGTTIGQFAKQNIEGKATIESDAYRSYQKPLANKYFHKFEVFKSDGDMLKWLHTIIGNAKSFVEGTYHGLESKYIQMYLDEFCYRFNRRFNNIDIFSNLITAVLTSAPQTLAELKG